MSESFDERTMDETPTPLPGEVMHPSEGLPRPVDDSLPGDDLPLHLRVLKAIVEPDPTPHRLDQALALANEVYELEVNGELEN
jgi:hypothetical protein